jgi:hypothetical protein
MVLMVPARDGNEGAVKPIAIVNGPLHPADLQHFDFGDGRIWSSCSAPTFSVPLGVLMWFGEINGGGVVAGPDALSEMSVARIEVEVDVLLTADEYPCDDASPEDARAESN